MQLTSGFVFFGSWDTLVCWVRRLLQRFACRMVASLVRWSGTQWASNHLGLQLREHRLTILKYFTWMQSAFDDWKRWTPARCIDYMAVVGNSKGLVACRGTSLLEAFRFCKFVMSIPVPDELLANPLVKGRAMRLSADQNEYHPARPLKALDVASLEKMMLTEMNSVDKYMLK